ncbi:CII protein [Escherichia phage HF4s]|nr:CII protein [Escherichia phage HF4s]
MVLIPAEMREYNAHKLMRITSYLLRKYLHMVRANKRNEALRIESALLNKIAMLGTEKTAEAVGVDKSQISRWKRDWIPKFSMLLAVLEWGVVDDDMARLARQVASILTNKKRPVCKTERSYQIQMEF